MIHVIRELESRREIDAITGCWNYTRGKTSFGYGKMNFKGKQEMVHRISAHLYKDFPLNLGKKVVLRHLCDNPACFNPDHLIEGTQSENIKDHYIRRENNKLLKELSDKKKR